MTAAPDQIDVLLARIATRTEALRDAAATKPQSTGSEAPTLIAERALVDDLRRLAAILRADATAIGESLARVLDAGPPRAEGTGEQP